LESAGGKYNKKVLKYWCTANNVDNQYTL